MTAADVGEAALAEFKGGLFCAESVLLAVARRLGVDCDQLPAVATGFCSGLARSCGPCGAVTGAVMGLGLAFGRDRGDQGVEQCYAATRVLLDRFADEFGSTACAELLGCDLGSPEGRQDFRDQGLATRCAAYTKRAAELAAELTEGC